MINVDRFLPLPIVKPNTPDGGYAVNSIGPDGKHFGYQEGAQTHTFVIPGLVKTIQPAPFDKDGNPLPGCYLYIDGQQQAIFVYLSADEARKLIEGAL